MTFISTTFLLLFLPLTLLLHALLRGRLRNIFLLIASLLFYAWGEPLYIAVLLLSITANRYLGRVLHSTLETPKANTTLGVGVLFNLSLLAFFKYTHVHYPQLPLPLGISFYTFQALAYLIDVYWQRYEAEREWIRLGLYLSLFPTVLSGPINRYGDIQKDLTQRNITPEMFTHGIQRFVVGLAKKVMLATPLSFIVDEIYALPGDALTIGLAWLGVVVYALQIYLDFSGYSDMAIGTGRMLGFRFVENFNYPYISRSLKEFWTRWHMSLSFWFRDYLYYPLMMNWRGPIRAHINTLIVFFLCGLWHGAQWTFVAWGLFHGSFLVLESLGLQKWLSRKARVIQHMYFFIVLSASWVFFRSDSLSASVLYFKAMFRLDTVGSILTDFERYSDPVTLLTVLVGIGACFPVGTLLSQRVTFKPGNLLRPAGDIAAIFVLLLGSLCYLAVQTHQPFIYFKF